jgi:predicted N-acyltransferase
MTSLPQRSKIEIARSFNAIDKAEWETLSREDFIFADLSFLQSLEDGGCLGERTGWSPLICLLRDSATGRLQAALPLYLKTNSYGEFIFDWAWANAAEHFGVAYYPKLTSAIPFTPATGPKLLLAPGSDESAARKQLTDFAHELALKAGAMSEHYLFPREQEAAALEQHGYLVRHSYQFHWQNRGWKTFDDFLASLRSKRRTEIKRERAAVAALPLTIRLLTGTELNESHADTMYEFYLTTISAKGGFAYLTKEFFRFVFARMPENVLLVLAYDENGKAVAGALNLFSGKALYGRYWGSTEDFRNLHFELCYYRTIDWALAHGIETFEAGAQGEQKFTRGFAPKLCFSAHRIENAAFRTAIARFIAEEKREIANLFEEYGAHDPYRRPETEA